MDDQVVEYNFKVKINENKFVFPGYVFKGWNTEADGSGEITYLDEQEIENLAKFGTVDLYAVWEEAVAKFDTGTSVNIKMKKMATDYTRTDTAGNVSSIEAIKYSSTIDKKYKTSEYLVSSSDSKDPIYMWYDEDDSTIYWWSDDLHPTLNSNASQMFRRLNGLKDISGLENFDVSNTTDFSVMFQGDVALTNLDALSTWTTTRLNTLNQTFMGCTNLEDISGISNFDTSRVIYFKDLFNGDTKLVDATAISGWDTTELTNINSMFSGCTSLEEVSFENWDLSKVNNVDNTFNGDTKLNSLYTAKTSFNNTSLMLALPVNLYNGNTSYSYISSTTDSNILLELKYEVNFEENGGSTVEVIARAKGEELGTLPESEKDGYEFLGWYTASTGGTLVSSTDVMGDSDVTYYAHWKGNDYKVIYNKNSDNATGSVTDSEVVYGDEFKIKKNSYYNPNKTFVSWNTKSDGSGDSYLEDETVSNLVTDGSITLYATWRDASSTLLDGAALNLKMKSIILGIDVTNTNATVSGVKSIVMSTTIPSEYKNNSHLVSTSDTDPVYMWVSDNNLYWYSDDTTPTLTGDGSYLFRGFTNLENLDGVANWDTTDLNKLDYAFLDCQSLKNTDGLLNWDISKVGSANQLFYKCYKLEDLTGLKNWDVSYIANFARGFEDCKALKTLDGLQNWKMTRVSAFTETFGGLESLEDASAINNWSFRSNATFSKMFILNGNTNPTLPTFTKINGTWGSDGTFTRSN